MTTVPLREVVQSMFAKSTQIDDLDHRILRCVRLVEARLRQHGVQRIVKTNVAPGVTLGWSSRRGAWRLVIVADDEAVPLLDVEPEERAEVFSSGAIVRLVEDAGLVDRQI